MSDHIRTRATPEQITHYFGGRGVKNTKRTRNVRLISQTLRYIATSISDDGTAQYELQLPLYIEANKEREGRWAAKDRSGKQIDMTLAMLQAHLRGLDRDAISGITLTRVGPGRLDDHDNLRTAFKHVLDAVCGWIIRGDEFNEKDRRGIGYFDGKLQKQWEGTGKTWPPTYEQTTSETDPKAHGVRIRLRLTSHRAASETA